MGTTVVIVALILTLAFIARNNLTSSSLLFLPCVVSPVSFLLVVVWQFLFIPVLGIIIVAGILPLANRPSNGRSVPMVCRSCCRQRTCRSLRVGDYVESGPAAVAISRLSRPLIWGPILLRVLYRNPHLAIYLGSLGPSVVVLRVMACGRSQCLQLEPLPETLGPETLDPKGKPKAQDPSSSRAKQARYNRNEFMPLDAKTAPRA